MGVGSVTGGLVWCEYLCGGLTLWLFFACN